MKVRASWRANVEDEAGPEEVERSIRKYLQQYPGLEALQDLYGVPAAEFWIEGQHITPYARCQEASGLEVCVTIEGEMENRFDLAEIATWSADRIWEELADYSDLIGFPERFEIAVTALP